MTHPTTHFPALPFLFYRDLNAAIPWLQTAFGATERFRLSLPNGLIAHAEVQLEEAIIMLGNVGPRNRQEPVSVRSAVYVFVPDVDLHFSRAQAAGVSILEPVANQPFGDRVYVASDCEGHEWYFAQHIHTVSVTDLQSMLAAPRGAA